ncbi:hypothetical protein [Dietzia timorensis]|uniref:Tyr recombinase domain-containing protein n=1 Tax=Dietzia timorensis TaxID=499555 RepID=A0A173LGG5_9ACTN|nr:hypothetical protein [Dietzia timorensis]ANI90879.1 Hypothetical protein BJL86_0068 [Dietzia timorensis]
MGRFPAPAASPDPDRNDGADEGQFEAAEPVGFGLVRSSPAPDARNEWGFPVRGGTDKAGSDADDARDARRQRLETANMVIASSPWSADAKRAAIELQLRTRTPKSAKNDVGACGALARYLVDEALGAGTFSVERALRRSAIDRYIAIQRERGIGEGTLRSRRSQLRAAARIMHPGEHVAGEEHRLGRSRAKIPATHAEVASWYRLAQTISAPKATVMTMMLDLGTGVGARASEMNRLTGNDVRVHRLPEGRQLVAVTLTNSQGRRREVPFFDPRQGDRVLARAEQVGTGPLFAGDRNVLNRVREHLVSKGHRTDFHSARLRYRWIVDLSAMLLPPAAFIQLADAYESPDVGDLRPFLPTYRVDQHVRLLDSHGKDA